MTTPRIPRWRPLSDSETSTPLLLLQAALQAALAVLLALLVVMVMA